MSNNECRFYPVQCTDEKFQTLSAQDGYVYFVTDKKKIYLGSSQNGMIPMSEHKGFFYGVKDISYDNSGFAPDPEVTFFMEEIEGSETPEINDLILNKDGCFYRVKDISELGLETVRLTLQGTGGGGGGGSDTPASGSFRISIIKPAAKVFASTDTKMEIEFIGYYDGADDNYISGVAVRRSGDENPFYFSENQLSFNTVHSIDIVQYSSLFNENVTTINLYVYDKYGNEKQVSGSVQIANLALVQVRDNIIDTFTNEYTYESTLKCLTKNIHSKKITYKLFAADNQVQPLKTWVQDLDASKKDTVQYTMSMPDIAHGIYILQVQASMYTGTAVGAGTLLTSNILTHKFAKYVSGSNQPLLLINIPESIEQYTDATLEYKLLTEQADVAYTLDIALNGISKIQLDLKSNVCGSYNLYFEQQGSYVLGASVVELNLTHTVNLDVKKYTGILPIIDPSLTELMLYLNPRNKSNDAVDRGEWSDYNGRYTGILQNMHYGTTNGWLADENGISYLGLSSGASFSLPQFRPFLKDPTVSDATDSRMGSGITIELDFEINGVLDYDSELISCVSRNKDKIIKTGFTISGDRARLYNSSGVLLSLNLVEGKRTRISFVVEGRKKDLAFPMAFAYLNGKISGAVIYGDTDNFNDVAEGPATFNVNSADAQIKIYGIRVYSTALSDGEILNNYTASLDTLNERQKAYESNDVYDSDGRVDLTKLQSEEYDLQIPYMLLTGGWATTAEDKWKLCDAQTANCGLPTGKKDYRLVDVQVVYPKNNSYFARHQDYTYINHFANGATMANAYGQKGGAIMYAQGTSSMEYPVKNLRLRFKNAENWFTVDPDIEKVNIICMKADYMESSGSHNTGAANLIDALYTKAGMSTPGQDHFGGPDKKKIVTCIKGHPCLIFYSADGNDYEYIGKYNLNLDKATPEPFGFNHDDDEFGYLVAGDEYYDILYDEDGKYVKGQVEQKKTVSDGEKINSIHCFEFLDNSVEVCNFLGKASYVKTVGLTAEQYNNNIEKKYYIKETQADGSEKYKVASGEFNSAMQYYINHPMSYADTWYNEFVNKENKKVPGWTLGFESRYPEDRVGFHDADALYPLASWLNELYCIRYGIGGVEKNEKLALARFKNEYQCYFDHEFLVTYYLITEALLMADSRVKNMMIATWGKVNYGLDKETHAYYTNYKLNSDGSAYIPDESSEKVMTNNYIFYPIFYDMDTMLGLDNTGVYRFNYYDEDTDASVYNGDEVLWNFVRDSLGLELKATYSSLEQAMLKANTMLPYFNDNQANLANEAFYNSDAKYKYINPGREGYYDHLNDKEIAPGAAPYLYAAQGDRSLMREWILTNRMKFLRGKYNSDQFKGGDRLEYRWYFPGAGNAPLGSEFFPNGEDHSATIQAVRPTGDFTLTSLKTGYAGVWLGAGSSTMEIERFNNKETKDLTIVANSANGTEAYILGLSTLSDLGDLSDKYMQKFIIASSDVRLENLTLGNPHRDYYNPYWGSVVDGQAGKIAVDNAIYLKTFNLQNCATYNNSLNFANCKAIERILLTGSSVSGVSLPVNGILKELRLPATVGTVKIHSHKFLNNDNFSIGGYHYDPTDPRIGAGSGYYVNDYSGIDAIDIVDTPNIDTYAMVKGARNLTKYYLSNVRWNINETDTQYCLRLRENVTDVSKIPTYYYYDSNDKEYKLWGQTNYPNDQSLYERIDMVDADNNMVCIPVLEYLQTKSFSSGHSHGEALTGTVEINIPGVKVNELEIYRKYANIYPNLTITYGTDMDVDGAYAIKFYYADADSIANVESIDIYTPYFSKLTANQEESLADIITNSGFTAPQRASEATVVYTYTGVWLDKNSGIKYYEDEFAANAPEGAIAFSAIKPTAHMNLFPYFTSSVRLYTVEFYDYNNTFLFDVKTTYNTSLASALPVSGVAEDIAYANIETRAKMSYQYRPSDNKCSEHERYALRGWISETSHLKQETHPAVYDIFNMEIAMDMKVFANYIIEDATQIASPLDMFTIEEADKVIGDTVYRSVIISMNNVYKHIAGGKITLPTFMNGKSITMIGNFQQTQIEDLYCLQNSTIEAISSNAFNKNLMLKNVYGLPTTLTAIGDRSFYDCVQLTNIALPDSVTFIGNDAFSPGTGNVGSLVLTKLPNSLITLGSNAFYNAGTGVRIQALPTSLTAIGERGLAGCGNTSITCLGSEAGDRPLSVGYRAFYNTGRANTEDTLYIYKGVDLQSNTSGEFNTFGGKTSYTTIAHIVIDSSVYALLGGDDDAVVRNLLDKERTGNMTITQIN